MKNTGYIVFAHGSSIESANQAVRVVAAEMARKGSLEVVEAAFLEGGKPSLHDAMANMANCVEHVVVVPYFLTLGLHLQRDLPKLIGEISAAHPHVRIDVAPPLDQHPAMVDALLDRARETACKPV